MTQGSDDGLRAVIHEALGKCMALGFERPMHIVQLALDGSIVAARVPEAGEPILLAQHVEPTGGHPPFYLLVVDAKGRGATFTLVVGKVVQWQPAERSH